MTSVLSVNTCQLVQTWSSPGLFGQHFKYESAIPISHNVSSVVLKKGWWKLLKCRPLDFARATNIAIAISMVRAKPNCKWGPMRVASVWAPNQRQELLFKLRGKLQSGFHKRGTWHVLCYYVPWFHDDHIFIFWSHELEKNWKCAPLQKPWDSPSPVSESAPWSAVPTRHQTPCKQSCHPTPCFAATCPKSWLAALSLRTGFLLKSAVPSHQWINTASQTEDKYR